MTHERPSAQRDSRRRAREIASTRKRRRESGAAARSSTRTSQAEIQAQIGAMFGRHLQCVVRRRRATTRYVSLISPAPSV